MKVTTKTTMLRALAAGLLLACTLPAAAQDRGRGRERSEEQEQEREARQERRREREERAAEVSGEAARQGAAAQEAERVQQQRERPTYERETPRIQRQPAEQPQERVRAIDRQGANERQQQAIELRNQQMRDAEARRVQQERQERGYGDTRDRSRDWDDGSRRGDYDRERDNRYAGGDRGRDGDRDWNRGDREDRDGRRDRDWDRDRNDHRWDQNDQRRWDNWQRDADRYRREAWQRHNANRYAALQQQQRARQYRYQQDYWQRQQRWYSGWNTRRFDRDWVFAPVIYRYSRGGRWYDINRYAADTLQEAIRLGYSEGARAGEADRYDGWRGGYRDNFVYMDADFGYDGYYVSLSEYQYYFREGFRRGYEDAYGHRYRYGRYSGGEYVIAAAVLDLILDLQDY